MGTQRLDFGCFAVPPCSVWTSLLYAFRTTLSRMDNQATLNAWGTSCCKASCASPARCCSAWPCSLRGRVKR